MSKYVDEIILDLKNNPDEWVDYLGCGCKKGSIAIYDYGNTRLLSVVKVRINDKIMPTTYLDCYRLEKYIGLWYRSISLKNILI